MEIPFKKAAVAAAVSAVVSVGAAAADAGPFIGGSFGQATVKISDKVNGQNFSLEDSDTGYKVFGGYMFNEYFGVEVGYVNFGNESDSFGYDGGEGPFKANIEGKASGHTLEVIGAYPIGPVDVFAKVGAISFSAKTNVNGSDPFGNSVHVNGDENSSDLAGGIGVMYKLGHFGFRAEAEAYSANNVDDLYLLSIGAQYNFF